MKGIDLKKFAVFFSLLLLIQESHELVKTKYIDSIAKSSSSNDFLKDSKKGELMEKKEERPKRFIFTLIFIFTTVVSISLTIYKEVRGCKDITPDLKPTVDKGKAMEKTTKSLHAQVEREWKPVAIKEKHTKVLASDLNTIRLKVNEYNTLKADIVKLLDRRLLDNVNVLTKKLENDVDNNDEESIAGFPDLLKAFGSEFQFALELSIKFITLGAAGFSLVSKSVSTTATNTAKNWASKNTGRMSKMISRFAEAKGTIARWTGSKISAFKASLNTKWLTSIGSKLIKFKGFFSKLGQTTIGKVLGKAVSFAGKAIVKVGASIAALIMFAFDIWNFIKFVKECHKKLRDARKALQEMTANKNELLAILTKIRDLKTKVDEYYGEMKGNIDSDYFKEFLGEVIKLGEGAQHQTNDIKVATTSIQNYINRISSADLSTTDALNKDLIDSFSKINYKLLCLKSKISIRMSVVDNCEDGKESFIYLYNEAKSLELSLNTQCIQQEYMSQSEIRGLVDVAMEKRGAQKVCIRNNDDKLKLACRYYAQAYSNERNAQLLQVTVNDIKYFITQCGTSELSKQVKLAICDSKADEKSLTQVLAKYSSTFHSQIRIVYHQCNLTPFEITSICSLKGNGYALSYIQNKFSLYPSSKVQTAFTQCQQRTSMTPNDGETVCNLKKVGISPEDESYTALFAGLLLKYDKSVIVAHYNNCS